jgi:hypothetical protein
MKKCFIIAMLVITGVQENLCAQVNLGWTYYAGKSKSDMLFDVPNTNWLRHRFVIALDKGNSITIQVSDKKNFESISNLDSMLKEVIRQLQPLKDSLQNELTNKRIDFLTDRNNITKMRLQEFQPKGKSYAVVNNELTTLKMEQDTLIILGGYTAEKAQRIDIQGIYFWLPYKITVLLNDINRLSEYTDGKINIAMQDIKQQWDSYTKWTSKKNYRMNLYAFYNTTDTKKNLSIRESFGSLRKKFYFEPYVQTGLQNINSTLITSAGAGFGIVNRLKNNGTKNYQLFWEPYFVFGKKADGGFKMRRNDFVTFQYTSSQTGSYFSGTDKIEFNQNLSIGYLIHRSGNFFKENTFKAGLPGAKYKFLLLYPEFIFNGLFKNFQPGLKLILDLD